MNFALIPARGGSKSIRKKNIALLGGKALIYYTISVAKQTNLIDRIFVSTDDEDIREISVGFGVEAPFLRPSQYATDTSGDFEVVCHFLSWLEENENIIPKSVIYLRADFPFRRLEILYAAIQEYLQDEISDGLRSVQRSKEIPFKTWRLKDGYLQPVVEYGDVKEPHNSSRQLFPDTFWPNGYIDIYETKLVMRKQTLKGDRMIPFIAEHEYQINIGEFADLERAEQILKMYSFLRSDDALLKRSTMPKPIIMESNL